MMLPPSRIVPVPIVLFALAAATLIAGAFHLMYP